MAVQPLISFIMPSHNRSPVLNQVLAKIVDQGFSFSFEIIVVDNNSSDNSVEMVNQYFPSVRLFPKDENLGAMARNFAIDVARGKYIVMLDDDSYPIARSIELAVRIFENDLSNEIGCIALNVRRVDGSYETAGIYTSFTGCGAIFKKDIFAQIGYYPEDYLFYVEEYDLSCRIWEHGFTILNFKELEVIHLKTGLSRDFNQIIGQLVKNNMLLWSKFLPAEYAQKQINTELWRYHKIAQKEDALRGFLRGRKLGELEVEKYRSNRQFELSPTTVAKVLDLNNIKKKVATVASVAKGNRGLIFYAGKLIHVVIDELRQIGYEVSGIIDDNMFMQQDVFFGVPVFSRRRLFENNYDFILLGTSSLALNDCLEKELNMLNLRVPIIRLCDYDSLEEYLES